jgi:hypothetical protein
MYNVPHVASWYMSTCGGIPYPRKPYPNSPSNLFESTLWKPSVKQRVQTIHAVWHQKLRAMRFVGEGEEDNFTADLWNQLRAFTNNHIDWQDQNALKAYFFKGKIT